MVHGPPRSQFVAVSSATPAAILHGVVVVQNWSLVIGAAAAGPKLGTVCSSWPLGDELGLALGVDEECAEGVDRDATLLPPLKLPRTTTPKMPRRITTMTAAAAGTSQGGRSAGPMPPRRGRGTLGLLGAGAGVGVLAGATGAGAASAVRSSFGMSIA